VEEWLLTADVNNQELTHDVDDLINEAYFTNMVSGELAVILLKFGLKHLKFDPDWRKIAAYQKVHPMVRVYAKEQLGSLSPHISRTEITI